MAVALYARVSTVRQAEKDLSIPDQLRQMKEWCKRNNLTVAAEYIEPGATATDDRRPEFQQMIADACTSPPPFDTILVHSLSRFFRDAIQLGMYERRLKKYGVKLVSITQETADDPTGQLVRHILSSFDEYQSKENAKHTLRAMKENARQGFFNGSTPPYGFRKVEVPIPGRQGNKKRLEVDPAEAAIVRKIYSLYLSGHKGNLLGFKGIAAHLNWLNITRRNRQWSKSSIADILSDTVYVGEYFFNKQENKTRTPKP